MGWRHPEPGDCLALEVEFNQHSGLVSFNPAIMPGLDGDHLWSCELQDAPVCILNVDLTVDEKSDMRVLAEIGADDRLHVRRPSKSGRVDHSLDTSPASPDGI